MKLNRFFPVLAVLSLAATATAQSGPIDRQAVVSRHNIEITRAEPMGAMAVGNGEIAFNFDVTGLQSFPAYYEKTMPIGILSTWGWHKFPNPDGFTLDKFPMTSVPKHDRTFIYPAADTAAPPPGAPPTAASYLRANPHRFGLARIGLEMTHADGSAVKIEDLRNISQKLDIWTGVATSSFEVDGQKVVVTTACQGKKDEFGVTINSPLLATGHARLTLAFPYALNSFGPDYQDWSKPDAHATVMTRHPERRYGSADFARTLDDAHYNVRTRWNAGTTLAESGKHTCTLTTTGDTLEFSAWFSPLPPGDAEADAPADIRVASAQFWKDYWTTGGIIDLSGNTDPRAAELERRIVLSQYVMNVHDASSIPPAETGLGVNSWFGKYHMEMYWWHAAHWALWGHADILEKSLVSLNGMMPAGQAMARREGCVGVKWSKMTDPSGLESPSGVGPILVWQQPHPIYLAELVYRAQNDDAGRKAVLEKYREIVFQTADYMASFVDYDPVRKQYVLGPAVGTADEKHTDYAHNLNPTLELGYWRWSLDVARDWRARLKLPADPAWDKVSAGLAPLTIRGGVYPALEEPVETTAAGMTTFLLGALPGKDIDREAMRTTLHTVSRAATGVQTAITWGTSMWAMCAVCEGEPDLALQLLAGKYQEGANVFMPSGYALRRPEQTPMYFPANGGWLTCAALMTAGWDGNTQPNPGFPKDWKVRWEGIKPLP